MKRPFPVLLVLASAAALLGCSTRLFATEAALTDDVATDGRATIAIDGRRDSPRKLNGASPFLPLKGATQKVFLKFNLEPLLETGWRTRLIKAHLRLFVNRVDSPGKIRVALNTGEWSEVTATSELANLQPSTQQVVSERVVERARTFIDIDVTALLKIEAGYVFLNQSYWDRHGFVLIAEGDAAMTFDSKENTLTSHPAFLQVTVAPAPPPQEGEIPQPADPPFPVSGGAP